MNRTTLEIHPNKCNCGCGASVGKKSRFAQGHDARFVSNMRQVALQGEKGMHTEVTVLDHNTEVQRLMATGCSRTDGPPGVTYWRVV